MHRWTIIIVIVACVGIIGVTAWWWFDTQRTVVVVIRDDSTRALPETVELIRGVKDTLIIRNESNIAPQQQIRQRFLSAGEYTFECTTHGEATMVVIVRDP